MKNEYPKVVKSGSLLGGYSILINGVKKYHFIMKRDATKKKNELINEMINEDTARYAAHC